MYKAEAIAKEFLKIARQNKSGLTNMQEQKLVYFAHGFYLALTDEPLIEEYVKAWTFGPVIPELYEKLRRFRANNIDPSVFDDVEEDVSEPVRKVLERIYEKYGKLGGMQMSYLTHRPGTPWQQTWASDPYGVIDDDLICDHFRDQVLPAT